MERAELQRYKRILGTMLENMEQPLRRRDEIAVENAPDTIDRVQQAADRDLAICQIESSFGRMQNVKLALERIEDGSYGTCLRCEDEISPKRLAAVPWTAYCIGCQNIADEERTEPASEVFGTLLHSRNVA
jgi:RNA polymerase-binding transcription factor